jgi:hypothetical protein
LECTSGGRGCGCPPIPVTDVLIELGKEGVIGDPALIGTLDDRPGNEFSGVEFTHRVLQHFGAGGIGNSFKPLEADGRNHRNDDKDRNDFDQGETLLTSQQGGRCIEVGYIHFIYNFRRILKIANKAMKTAQKANDFAGTISICTFAIIGVLGIKL